jgi:hypothetical protein
MHAGKVYRLNWATHGLSGGKGIPGSIHGEGTGPEYSLFVGDLAHDVTDYQLMNAFAQYYPSVKNAKVRFVLVCWRFCVSIQPAYAQKKTCAVFHAFL